jgi:hypothetical protein
MFRRSGLQPGRKARVINGALAPEASSRRLSRTLLRGLRSFWGAFSQDLRPGLRSVAPPALSAREKCGLGRHRECGADKNLRPSSVVNSAQVGRQHQ